MDKIIRKHIENIVNSCGPRIAGSEEEYRASQYIYKNLQENCDDTYFDEFDVYPRFYPHGFLKMASILIIGALFTIFFSFPYLFFSLGLLLLGLFIIYLSLFRMNLLFAFDFLFKKSKSWNATGRIYPRDSNVSRSITKKQVIVCGHTDSAFEMSVMDKGFTFLLLGVGYLLISLFLLILKLFLSQSNLIWVQNPLYSNSFLLFTYIDLIFIGISLIGLPCFLYLLNGLISGDPVIGANDNLSGVGISLALTDYFSKSENRLKNVELWAGSFGSEECGERGAHAFVKKYLKSGEIHPNFSQAVIPESVGAGDRVFIISKEFMHNAKHHPEVCNRLLQANKMYNQQQSEEKTNFQALPCSIVALPFAGSDAGRFAHVGIPSSFYILYEGKTKPRNYHSRKDDLTNLDSISLNISFEMIKNYLILLDQEISKK
ncbi:hypothetical protein NEF87_000903 [Candidatus Lokiarchaeum ossiferum]|uniref:Peptidase M28 domain-containing protein n=1 Tax=Candidatus Lokiarchaeum ossiferum TaxID=2951803 RepID=A0ABY6HM76_9ARCH|nr:hypothetical protein NEF87_000903 [Candidatus Lokiarchaeum sp. B-35]